MTAVLEDWGDGNRGINKLQQLYIYWNSNMRTQVQLILFHTEAPLWMEETKYHQSVNTKTLLNQLIWLKLDYRMQRCKINDTRHF